MNIEKIDWHGIDAVLLETNVYEAIIVPSIGANLVKLYNKVMHVDILRTPTTEEIETFLSRPQIFGVPLLFPPNRIEDGKYSFAGKNYEYPITIPDQNNYHHGIIKSQPFTITRTRFSSDAVEVEASFFSNKINNAIYANFPHEFVCKIRLILTDNELTHIVTFNNLGTEPMPLGVGYHTPIRLPFSKNTDKSDYKLRLSAGKRWELSDRSLPTENLLNLSEEESLLRTDGMTVTGKPIEIALTDEAIIDNGRPYHGAILTNTKDNVSVYYEVDSQFKHWTLWNNGGEVDWVCPEPQTWAINAPNLNLPAEITGMQSVGGGKSWSGTTRFYVK
ncbi:MAG TPA: aldose 1-epimerase [Paludibacter sp.]|nr:aldose 1-epimerase [Paludibacter sp.]